MKNRPLFNCFLAGLYLLVIGSSPIMALIEVQQGVQLETESSLYQCGISPDGTYAAVGGQSTQIVKIFNAATGALSGTATLPSGVETEDLELSNSGNRIVVGGQSNGVYCYNRFGALLWSRPDISGELSVGVTTIGDLVFTMDTNDRFYRLNGATGANLIAPVLVNTRGWYAWGVDTTVTGNRVLLMTNSDIIITDGFGNETHFYDIVAGNYLHYADLSPDGTHFVVSFRDPVTSSIKVSLYQIGVGEKWIIPVSGLTDVAMDNHNWIYVSTSGTDKVLYNTTGSEITRWGATGRYISVTDSGSRCVVEDSGSSTRLYNFVDQYTCYPDLHMQAYITKVVPYDADTKRYTLTIANWYDVPPELFVASPELPACGLNDQAGRTYIRIKGNEGALYFNGCGAWSDGTSSEFLKTLSFLVDDTEPLDPYIYLELWDRKCDQYLYSTYAYSRKPCPVGDLDGDCIVNLRDFTLMAENWLVNRNP